MATAPDLPWSGVLHDADAAPQEAATRHDDGAGDVIKGIVIGLALGVSAWAALIAAFLYIV